MTDVTEQAAAYAASRERVDALLRPLGDDRLDVVVPCCPRWTVRDVVGHLTGLLEDRRDGHLPTDGFEAWTDEQVARHRGEPLGAVLDRWRSIDVVADESPPSLAALSFDAVSHEHDVCQALGVAGDRTSDSVRVGADRAQARMSSMLQSAGAPGVLVRLDEEPEVLLAGGADPVSLAASRYELMRLVTGRLSERQARALDWDGAPDEVLAALFADGFFTLQPVDVVEVGGP